MTTSKGQAMEYVLNGFTTDRGFRVFRFQSSASPEASVGFTVRADVTLLPKYGIRLQELPLLCRELLDRRDHEVNRHELVFSEEEMCIHAKAIVDARNAAGKKKGFRQLQPANLSREAAQS